MASGKASTTTLSATSGKGGHASPPPSQLRQRPLGRAATFADSIMPPNRRPSSLFSDTMSESRKSLRSSTDDLLLPRVNGSASLDIQEELSHLHSIPLALALLPAVGGLLHNKGSAYMTDITLLALAAIFLNWSVRLPWDWYLSAQATSVEGSRQPIVSDTIGEDINEDDGAEEALTPSEDTLPTPHVGAYPASQEAETGASPAQKELKIHEVLALLACFAFPAIGAWLLHGIRSQLSRPSEGLVSNYNLTIFLLASEIRPLSHLVKMVLARTLYLQRVVNANVLTDVSRSDDGGLLDLSKRLGEMEGRVAESAEKRLLEGPDSAINKTTAQVISEVRRGIQPELDALNRAVRRYEKRATISTIQTEGRLQDLESRLKDVVVLAAAAHRNAENQPRNYIIILGNWLCAVVVVPSQYLWQFVTLPVRVSSWVLAFMGKTLGSGRAIYPKEPKYGKFLDVSHGIIDQDTYCSTQEGP